MHLFSTPASRIPPFTKLLHTLLFLLLPLLGQGQAFIGTYSFGSVTTSTGTTDPTPIPTATGVVFGSFSAVGTPANPNAGNRFSFINWPIGATDGSDTFANIGVNLGEYYSVTLTPQAGFTLSLTSITFTLQRTTNGIRQYLVRSSADNYATNLPASIAPANTNLSVVTANVFQVVDASTASVAYTGSTVTLGGAGYTNVSGPVTFRFYGFNAETTGGSFSIDDVKVTGSTTATNAPTISTFTPASGPVGTSVTINGAFFTTSSTVAFNGTAATSVVVTNASTLVAAVPSGATTGPITVGTSGGTATSATPYTVTVPTVTASPTSLTGFAAATSTASTAQTYQLSGSALNGNNLTIASSNANFEVSLDGITYGASASIALGGSTTLAATTIYVRLASGTALGSASATIANTNGTVTTNVAVSGAVVAPLVAKRWTGAANTTSWFDAANWEGNTLPVSTDDVVLDHRYVAAKYTVSLSSGTSIAQSATTVNSLRIRPFAGDSILFIIPTSNTLSTSNSGLALSLTRTVTGDTALLVATKGAFINRSGATVGDVFDPAGSNPTAFLLNGGSFYHRTARGNTVLVENLSGAAGTETGNFFFRIPGSSTTISGQGRTYGNLTLQRGGASSYVASGTGSLTINGNLTVESGVTFSSTITGNIVLKGNLMNGGNFRFEPASAGTDNRRLVLQGTAPQVVSGTTLGDPASGALSYLGANAQLEIANTAGITLQTPVTLSNVLTLTSGTLNTTASTILTLAPTATIAVSNTGSSYVNGLVARPIAAVANATGVYTSFTFPLGKGTSYRPIILNINSQTGTTTYRAELFEGDPGQNVAGSDLVRVSKVRSYTITPLSGGVVMQPSGFNGTVTLPATSSDGVNDPSAATLVVGKRTDATQPWVNIGRSTATSSTLTSAPFSSFSDFVLASTSTDAGTNPLPVTLVSFDAARRASGEVHVAWATASEQHSAYFDVQRSFDGHIFASTEQLPASGTTTQAHYYSSFDKTAPAGTLYYRLRQVDIDGTATYSPIVTVAISKAAFTLYPNPAHSQLTVASAAGQEAQVCDLAGRLRLATTLPASGKLSLDTLPPGTYLLRVTLGGQTRTIRFTKD
jgi:hypothetical protein